MMPKHSKITNHSAGGRGFTIVEIVIAFIIIGILAAILTPTLINRTHEARIKAARQDLQHLADAEERAAIDTGYMYRPYVLNDVPGYGDGKVSAPKTWPPNPTERDRIGSIFDNSNAYANNNLYTNPAAIFIQAKSADATGQDFAGGQGALFLRLFINETEFGWNGPYLNWSADANHNDWPDDPWGNDYLFFTAKGLLYPPVRDPATGGTGAQALDDGSAVFQDYGPDPGKPGNPTSHRYRAKPDAANLQAGFDRPTFLSLGPNGMPGNGGDPNDLTNPDGYGKGDDIWVSFGGN